MVFVRKMQTGLHFARGPQVVGEEEITFNRMIKSHCALWNFLMEVNKDKRQSTLPWGSLEVKPGNDNSVSRQKQLAYPSEYSRWCPSHLCWASDILASANTDEGGPTELLRQIQSAFPVSVIFFLLLKKPLVQCISHNLCLSSLVPWLTSTNRLTLQMYVHMAALIVILHGGAL